MCFPLLRAVSTLLGFLSWHLECDLLVRPRASGDEFRLHGREAPPTWHGGSKIDFFPFGVISGLGLQLGEAIEQVVNKPCNAPMSVAILAPIIDSQKGGYGDRLDLLTFGYSPGIVS